MVVVIYPNPLKRINRMDKITRKTSFEQWVSPISNELFEEQVKNLYLDYYTKKLHMASFMKLLLFAPVYRVRTT